MQCNYFSISVNSLPSKWLFFHHCNFFSFSVFFLPSVWLEIPSVWLEILQCDFKSFSVTSDPSVLLEISSVCLEISSGQLGFNTFQQIVPTSLVQVYSDLKKCRVLQLSTTYIRESESSWPGRRLTWVETDTMRLTSYCWVQIFETLPRLNLKIGG